MKPITVALALCIFTVAGAAVAEPPRQVEGAVAGAVGGAVVAGPVGALVGGVGGAVVGRHMDRHHRRAHHHAAPRHEHRSAPMKPRNDTPRT